MKRSITISSEKLKNEIEDAYKDDYIPPLIYQPERSKREDFDFEKLADLFWSTEVSKEILENWEEENGAIKILDKFAKWLNQRCGALNTVVTS